MTHPTDAGGENPTIRDVRPPSDTAVASSAAPSGCPDWSGRNVGAMPDSDELARMMLEISAGWEWGDPRSKVPQTPEHEASWGRLKVQMQEIANMGGSSISRPAGQRHTPNGHPRRPANRRLYGAGHRSAQFVREDRVGTAFRIGSDL